MKILCEIFTKNRYALDKLNVYKIKPPPAEAGGFGLAAKVALWHLISYVPYPS